jgi:hypothetical protein
MGVPETPASVVVAYTADGRPFPGAYALVRLPMWHKNQDLLLFEPSGDDGFIRISGSELKQQADQVQAFFLMDYETFPARWTGGMGAEILTLRGSSASDPQWKRTVPTCTRPNSRTI